jgi:hypothetical protein
LQNATGDLYIKNYADDKDIIFQSDNGENGVETYFFLDGSLSSGNPFTVFPDDSILTFGNSQDLQFKHSGGNSFIDNTAGGALIIRQFVNDQDIIFQSDDGSGGTTEYFRLDGGLSSPYTVFPDNSTLTIGTGFDLKMYHNGSNSYIDQTGTGNLYIRNTTDDADIIFQSDDGSGGVETYFFLDGSVNSGSNAYTVFPDTSVLAIGSGRDLRLSHNGTDSYVQNLTGDLILQNQADDKDIILKSDDGSGGETAYLTLDGSATNMKAYKDMRFIDNVDAEFGDGGDFKIYHDGSNTYLEQINSGTGNIVIANANDDADIIFKSDDGSGGTTAYLTLDGGLGHTTVQKEIRFDDVIKATFGASGDLQLSHNGSSSALGNFTGDLYITQYADDKDIAFYCDDGSGGITAYLTLDGSAGTIVVDKPLLINGAAIQASPKLYGSIIKLLPSDFAANIDGGNTKFGVGYTDTAGSAYGMKVGSADTELFAFVSIPEGMKATHVDVFDKDSRALEVFEVQINATSLTSKGSGSCNTTLDITDVNATATNFLAIKITTTDTTDKVFGGQVTIAAQ